MFDNRSVVEEARKSLNQYEVKHRLNASRNLVDFIVDKSMEAMRERNDYMAISKAINQYLRDHPEFGKRNWSVIVGDANKFNICSQINVYVHVNFGGLKVIVLSWMFSSLLKLGKFHLKNIEN